MVYDVTGDPPSSVGASQSNWQDVGVTLLTLGLPGGGLGQSTKQHPRVEQFVNAFGTNINNNNISHVNYTLKPKTVFRSFSSVSAT